MERIGTLLVAPSTERKAEPGRFATALRNATTEIASGLASGVTLAAPYLPGGAVLAGALRSAVPPPTAGQAVASLSTRGATLAGGGAGTTTGPAVTLGASPASGAAAPVAAAAPVVAGPGAGGGDLMEATRALQEQAQTFNLQYLELQESMQRESREFTALSNVMKVRHDSAKAAIGNIH